MGHAGWSIAEHIGAMGTHAALAQQIVVPAQGAEYLLTLKENQQRLYRVLAGQFRCACPGPTRTPRAYARGQKGRRAQGYEGRGGSTSTLQMRG